MTRLEELAQAIQWYEGWYPFSRSWRNNNPGNLRFSRFQAGHKDGFAYFTSFASGWLALWWDLYCKCTNKTGTPLKPESTLLELIRVWAPDSDMNNSLAYAEAIAKKLNCSIYTKLKTFVTEV